MNAERRHRSTRSGDNHRRRRHNMGDVGTVCVDNRNKRLPSQHKIVKRALARYNNEIEADVLDTGRIDATIRLSMELPHQGFRNNLYAVCMPSGHGKSFFCDKYNLLDVDACIPGNEGFAYYELISTIIEEGELSDLTIKGKRWFEAVNMVLDKLTFREPTVILVNDMLTANMIGARCLGGIMIDMDVVINRNCHRDKSALGVIKATTRTLQRLKDGYPDMQVIKVKSYESADMRLHEMLRVNGMPIPYCTQKQNAKWYKKDGPWSRQKMYYSHEEVSECVEAFENGDIPWCAVRALAKATGVSMNQEWRVGWNDYASWATDILSESYYPVSRKDTGWLDRAIDKFELNNHMDCRMLIDRCSAASRDFKFKLVMWWKFVGQNMTCNKEVFDMILGVGQSGWRRSMNRVLHSVRGSGMFMSTKVTMEDIQAISYGVDLETGWVDLIESSPSKILIEKSYNGVSHAVEHEINSMNPLGTKIDLLAGIALLRVARRASMQSWSMIYKACSSKSAKRLCEMDVIKLMGLCNVHEHNIDAFIKECDWYTRCNQMSVLAVTEQPLSEYEGFNPENGFEEYLVRRLADDTRFGACQSWINSATERTGVNILKNVSRSIIRNVLSVESKPHENYNLLITLLLGRSKAVEKLAIAGMLININASDTVLTLLEILIAGHVDWDNEGSLKSKCIGAWQDTLPLHSAKVNLCGDHEDTQVMKYWSSSEADRLCHKVSPNTHSAVGYMLHPVSRLLKPGEAPGEDSDIDDDIEDMSVRVMGLVTGDEG